MSKIKKLLVSLLAFLMLATVAPLSGVQAASANETSISNYKSSDLSLNVKSALAIDASTGQVLYAKNANKALPIASMTKLITVYLTLQAIKQGKISWSTKVKPTSQIVKVANNSEYSNVPLYSGHSYTVKQLYEATLIESANGAAMMLAKAISGNQVTFVKKMRALVKKWGITDAEIYNVNGLPNSYLGTDAYPGAAKNAENHLSAKDMAIIGMHLIDDYPEVLNTTKIAKKTFVDGSTKTQMTNFNWMLKGLSSYDSRYPVDGLKTGTTDAAGACFIGTVKKNGGRIITVVMGAQHKSASDASRFKQTDKLLTWIYANYKSVNLTANSKLMTVKVPYGEDTTANVGVKQTTTLWDPVDGKSLSASLTRKTVNAPLTKGKTVTTANFKSGSTKLISLNSPNGMKVKVASLQNDNEVNFFVKIWRTIFGK
ncbi:D-alanyl-D-alanine carboxypeptidase [Lactobacillus corticis]|uniref:serine-type D-Ala-D-Ala carboxypeptidase n=2 Tax=Lactobacillus corticis TaxID=2201249 RepID=A0A916VHW2_9LACO|nr:D-alanyl-D-alanine carboxypeptidase [Lactobacillus corticis]